MKEKNKTIANKNTNIMNIIRWGLILPVAYLEWWLCWQTEIAMDTKYRTYYSRAYDVSATADFLYSLIELALLFVIPFIMMFFTTRYLAPKYKNTIAVAVTIFGVLWCVSTVLWGLAHMAY